VAVCLRERQGFSAEDIDEGYLFTGEMSGMRALAGRAQNVKQAPLNS
jgi:hypothetical protein